MTDQELVDYCAEFRAGLLGGGDSYDMCFAVCAPLEAVLDLAGVSARMVESDLGDRNHVWLLLDDGRVLDPTADQFGLAPVYLGEPQDIHRLTPPRQ